MSVFSQSSLDKLSSCHDDLKRVVEEVIKVLDFKVLEGHRGEEAQTRAFREGKSKVKWPESKHNGYPSTAVDLAPYPIDWKDRERFVHLAGVVKGIAHSMGIPVRWGGDWDGDGNIVEHKFQDLPHFELVG